MVRMTPEILQMIKKGISLDKILRKVMIDYPYKNIRGRNYGEPTFRVRGSGKEGEIVGIFAGDGSQHFYKPGYHYRTNIHFGVYPEYIFYVKELFDS